MGSSIPSASTHTLPHVEAAHVQRFCAVLGNLVLSWLQPFLPLNLILPSVILSRLTDCVLETVRVLSLIETEGIELMARRTGSPKLHSSV